MSTRVFPGMKMMFFIFTISAVLLGGCSKDSEVTNPGGSSSIEGYVTDGSGLEKSAGGIESAVITVGKIQSDGSLSIVSTSAVQTDINGHYLIEVSVVNERNLVVVATKGALELRAVVSAEVKANTTVQAPPMTVQTTVEAAVFTHMAADGNPNFVTIADLRSYIDAFVASDIKGNNSAIVTLATAIGAEAQARAHALASAEIGATQEQIEGARNATLGATASLDAALHASWNNPPASRAALEVFFQATINAYVNNGIDIEKYSRARVASLRAMLQWSSQLSAETRFHLEQRVAYVRALLMDHVSQVEFQALQASQTQMNAVVSAGLTLKASVSAATTSQQIIQAFTAYHDAIVQALSITLSSYAAAIVTVDGNITKNNGYKAQLVASIQASVTPQQIILAYWSYYNQVRTAVIGALAGAPGVQIQVVTSLLVMVNMY